jgi:multicomponent Na+:H+ antiporter subunit A
MQTAAWPPRRPTLAHQTLLAVEFPFMEPQHLIAAVFSGFGLAILAPGLHRLARGGAGWLLASLPLGLAVYFANLARATGLQPPPTVSYPWAPELGVQLSFRLDGLSLLFALLITGVGALILIYSGSYLAGHPRLGRLYALLLMFMASMLGLVLADNVLALFVFWELTSLSSYLLIGFDHERAPARAAALQALLITGGGGLALLAGLLLLGQAGGSLELSTLLGLGEEIRSHPLYPAILVLVLLGAFTKSAQFPFHFWLPGAMEAPTPISAYLHSATMVKAGIYLLARLSPALGGTDLWTLSVGGAGACTMLLGAWLATQQSDLKRILAYSTVSALGMLTLLLGLGGQMAIVAAMAFLLGHALYKGALFLVAGAIDHETGTRDVDQLRGLGLRMPVTALAAALAALSLAGIPPLFGFIAKELFYEASLQAPLARWTTAAVVGANVLLVAIAGWVGLRPFLGKRAATPRDPHEAPPGMWLGPLFLAGLGLAMGVWPDLRTAAAALLRGASESILHANVEIELALWHGLNPALRLSALTLACGIVVYLLRGPLRKASRPFAGLGRWGPAAGYELSLKLLVGLADGQTRLLQSGYLRYYLWIILVTSVGLVGTSPSRAVAWSRPGMGRIGDSTKRVSSR